MVYIDLYYAHDAANRNWVYLKYTQVLRVHLHSKPLTQCLRTSAQGYLRERKVDLFSKQGNYIFLIFLSDREEGSTGPYNSFSQILLLSRGQIWPVFFVIFYSHGYASLDENKNQIDPVVFSLISIN